MRNATSAKPVPASAMRAQPAAATPRGKRPVEHVRRERARSDAGCADERVEHVVVAGAEDHEEDERRVEQREPGEHGTRSQPQGAGRDQERVAEVQADRGCGLVAQRTRVRRWAVRERNAVHPVRRRERIEGQHRQRRDVQQRIGRAKLRIAHGVEQSRDGHEAEDRGHVHVAVEALRRVEQPVDASARSAAPRARCRCAAPARARSSRWRGQAQTLVEPSNGIRASCQTPITPARMSISTGSGYARLSAARCSAAPHHAALRCARAGAGGDCATARRHAPTARIASRATSAPASESTR